MESQSSIAPMLVDEGVRVQEESCVPRITWPMSSRDGCSSAPSPRALYHISLHPRVSWWHPQSHSPRLAVSLLGFPWALVWALTEADPETRMCRQVSCLGEDSQGMAWQGSWKWHREENEASTVANTQHSVPLGTPGSQCMAHMVVPPERGVGVFTHQTPLSLPACHAPWQNCHLADGTGAGRKWK